MKLLDTIQRANNIAKIANAKPHFQLIAETKHSSSVFYGTLDNIAAMIEANDKVIIRELSGNELCRAHCSLIDSCRDENLQKELERLLMLSMCNVRWLTKPFSISLKRYTAFCEENQDFLQHAAAEADALHELQIKERDYRMAEIERRGAIYVDGYLTQADFEDSRAETCVMTNNMLDIACFIHTHKDMHTLVFYQYSGDYIRHCDKLAVIHKGKVEECETSDFNSEFPAAINAALKEAYSDTNFCWDAPILSITAPEYSTIKTEALIADGMIDDD